MPVYNGERYVEDAILCILRQTFTDFEFIISDNASTDRTEIICRTYAAKDRRIRYIRNDINLGISKNFNNVVEFSRGKYFKWVAHDDRHAETFLERCLEAIEKDSTIVLSYTKSKIIDENGKIIELYNDNLDLQQVKPHKRIRQYLKNVNLVNALYGIIKTSSLKNTRLIGGYISSDYNTLLELCILGKFVEVPEYLFFRRDRKDNVRKMSAMKQMALADPIHPQSDRYPRLRLILEQWKSIGRSEIDAYEKILCYLQLPHWINRLLKNKLGIYKNLLVRRIIPGKALNRNE